MENYKPGNHEIIPWITGIGSLMASHSLTQGVVKLKPDFIVQASIAGSFSPQLLPPQVVVIKDEILGDLGVQEEDDFKDIFDLKLQEPSIFPYYKKCLTNPLLENKTTYYDLPIVNAVTINEITTNPKRIELLKQKYQPAVESMEGAVLHYIGIMEKIPFLQIRAVSNMVGERDKTKWQMKEAIAALNEALNNLLPQL